MKHPHGHRRLHLRGCGRAVSLSPSRRGATAACGAPQGNCSPRSASAEAGDGRTLRFLLMKTLALKKKEEDEERRNVEVMEQAKLDEELLAVPPECRTRAQCARLWELVGGRSSLSQGRRKRRKKKKLPRGVSSRGRARRRQRQCLVHGWSVFPLVDDWPQMLGIMAGMDQKDSNSTRSLLRSPSALAVVCAWLVLRVVLLALCSLLLSSGPRCSTLWPVWTRGAAMQRDLAAFVVTAMACACLVLLVAIALCSL